MTTRKSHFMLWVSALLLILACVPSVGTSIPTVDPNLINDFIMQTAQAAATRTAAALPTSTPTATVTATPRNTSTASPTVTATFIFRLTTATSPFTPTLPKSAEDYACQVISTTPANGTAFNARANFDAVWRVMNIGKKTWDTDIVDYVFEKGAKLHRQEGYDLESNVRSERTTDIAVDMRAPRNAGTFTTNWVIRAGKNEFCRLSLTINVR